MLNSLFKNGAQEKSFNFVTETSQPAKLKTITLSERQKLATAINHANRALETEMAQNAMMLMSAGRSGPFVGWDPGGKSYYRITPTCRAADLSWRDTTSEVLKQRINNKKVW
jgi:hypothetical protein